MKINEKDQNIVLITGSTDGIGLQTAIELLRKNFFVILHGRNKERLRTAMNIVSSATGIEKANIGGVVFNLGSLKEIRTACDYIKNNFPGIDVLINNAGVYSPALNFTDDGFELTFGVNHLGHFLLTNLLLALIRKSKSGKIINVSSVAHSQGKIDFDNLNAEKYYDAYTAYAQSKFANILFTYRLAKILKDENIAVNSLHPGVISTKLLHAGFNIRGKSPAEGAKTSVYLAVAPIEETGSGKYFIESKPTQSAPATYDENLQIKLWDVSTRMVKL